jgi:hypothetical protein
MPKKKAATVTPKLTEGERDLLSQMEDGYQLETDSLGGNLVLRKLKDGEVTRPLSANASSVNPSVEMASVGVQNRRTLNALLPSRLAMKNRAKDTTAISQHQGEAMLPKSVAVIAPNPTVLAPPIRNISGHNGTSKATSIAATPLSATLK